MSNLKVSIYCPHCRRHTALQFAPVEYRTDYGTYEFPAIWKTDYENIWWIGVCNYCQKPVLVKNKGEIIYPNPLPSPTDERIPENIRLDLDEAKQCNSIHAFRACAVMARRAIQSTAIAKGATKEDLVSQINELESNGVITNDLKEWATVVRWVGNDAAHPNKDIVSQEDAEDILNLVEQFLNVIFVTPALAQEKRKKRGK